MCGRVRSIPSREPIAAVRGVMARKRGKEDARNVGSGRMTDCVALLIVSHSRDVARGVADMVRQMAGLEVPVAWTGGNADGKLGTDLGKIREALDAVWRPEGVVMLVDLGGAETNSEMAVEMLPPERREKVVICNAPIVEGAIMAAAEAASGGDLAQVRNAAEEIIGA